VALFAHPDIARVLVARWIGVRAGAGSTSCWLCELSRLLIDYVSAILPRAQAVSRMPSAIAALRMCCQRRVCRGNVLAHAGSAAQEVSQLVVAAAISPR
jgi:hypothetical protein